MTMSAYPSVSIVIPTYNRAGFLKEALESVLAQTVGCWEAVVVDDGSTDGTEAVVKSFADPRIRYIRQPNRGVSAARNRGIEEARFDTIAFLDSDDLWMPDKLERQLGFLAAHPEVGFLYGQIERHYLDSGVRKILPEKHASSYAELLELGNITFTPTVIIKRKCLAQTGLFDTNLTIVEDYELWLRIAKLYPIAFLPGVSCRVRIHSGNSSADEEKLYLGYLKACEKLYANFGRDMKDGGCETANSILRYRYLLGGIYLKTGRPRLAFRFILSALLRNGAVGTFFLTGQDSILKRILGVLKPYAALTMSAVFSLVPQSRGQTRAGGGAGS